MYKSLRIAKAVLKKEVREVVRDKKTLFISLFLPLIFYPVMLLVSLGVSQQEKKSQLGDPIRIGLIETGQVVDFIHGENIQVVAVDNAQSLGAKADIVLKVEEGSISVYYHSSIRGMHAHQMVQKLLSQHIDEKVRTHLLSIGQSPKLVEPYDIKWLNASPPREEIGRKFGGAGAYFLIFLALTGCMSVAVDAGAGERERGTLEVMMTTPASLFEIGLGKLCFVIFMGLLSVVATFIGLSSLFLLHPEVKTFLFGLLNFTFCIQLTLTMISVVICFASILYGSSLLSSNSREAHMKASLFMMSVAVLLIIAGAETVSNSYWVTFIPVMNAAAWIKNALIETQYMYAFLGVFCVNIITSVLFLLFVTKKNKRFTYFL